MTQEQLAALGWRPFFQQQLNLDEYDSTSPARVVGVERDQLQLLSGTTSHNLSLPRQWQALAAIERPTVGDWVLLDQTDTQLVRLLDRQSLFKRRAAGDQANEQLIAANLDAVFIVSSCNADFNLSRLERYLAVALEAQVTPVIVLTKADLCADTQPYQAQAQALHAQVVVVCVNALSASSTEALAPWCTLGQTVALLGSSGVGKSTLLNTLIGTQVQSTGGIREDDAKGRHTTTSRSLHHLPSGALVLDSPGMRELQLTDVSAGLGELFQDIESLAATCRFGNCEHESEPGCAVQAAIESETLELRRLRNYQKLLREEAHNNMSIAERHAKARSFSKLVKQHKVPSKRRH